MCVDGIEMSVSANASKDVCWTGAVEIGGGTVAVATGAE